MISRWCCLSRIAAKKACASSGVVKGAHVTVNQPRMVRRYLYGMVPYRRTFATKISFGSLTVLEFVALALGELLLSQNLQLLGHKSSLTTLVRAHGDLVLFVWLALVLVCCFLSREGLFFLWPDLWRRPQVWCRRGRRYAFLQICKTAYHTFPISNSKHYLIYSYS